MTVAATYRVQLSPDFGFEDAAAVAGYLADLGITHLYASPYLRAVPGSTHGYDVVDHGTVNPELGGEKGRSRLVAALRAHGLSHVLDIVPNHMAVAPGNTWWWDVLTHGRASRYARYFDVDWDPPEARLRDKVLIPVLGDHYGRVLEAGELALADDGGAVVLRYHEHRFPTAPGSVDGPVAEINRDPDRLDAVIDRQHYRLAYWRTAERELDYRRFFDISGLIALRVEDREVFDATHARVLGWLEDGSLEGVRVDHVDGLRDPEQYLTRLVEGRPTTWCVVEKILEPAESLPEEWPVAGTTGYDFLNLVTGLFVDPAAERPLCDLAADLTGLDEPWPDVARAAKADVMRSTLAAEVNRVTELWLRICERHRRFRDFTRHELHEAVREVAASFPVYRTYVTGRRGPSVADVATVEAAVADAAARREDLDPEVFGFLADLLLWRAGPEPELVARFQQLTGPVMAKGVEDTAFYRHLPLVALNEVGGDPGRFGTTVDEFHRWCAATQASHPSTLLALATHDTKRGEDVRARLCLLSQMADRWAATVSRWHDHNAGYRDGDGQPDGAMELLLYQTVVGAWPLPVDRASAYLLKAAREAKVHTSWVAPDDGYEAALARFVAAVLADRDFVAEVTALAGELARPGWATSLAQTLLKLTAPGVPDSYQGTELWDMSLVDPDNRRPVDFEHRRRLLSEVGGLAAADTWARAPGGLPKLKVVHSALKLRQRRPDLFGPGVDGGYDRLEVEGGHAGSVVAYTRGGAAATVVPRLVLGLERWDETAVHLPVGRWTDVLDCREFDGGAVPVDELFATFPVALLERRR